MTCLCPQVVSQVPQHFTSSKARTTCGGCLFVCFVVVVVLWLFCSSCSCSYSCSCCFIVVVLFSSPPPPPPPVYLLGHYTSLRHVQVSTSTGVLFLDPLTSAPFTSRPPPPTHTRTHSPPPPPIPHRPQVPFPTQEALLSQFLFPVYACSIKSDTVERPFPRRARMVLTFSRLSSVHVFRA